VTTHNRTARGYIVNWVAEHRYMRIIQQLMRRPSNRGVWVETSGSMGEGWVKLWGNRSWSHQCIHRMPHSANVCLTCGLLQYQVSFEDQLYNFHNNSTKCLIFLFKYSDLRIGTNTADLERR
jgi:hypothetical protein